MKAIRFQTPHIIDVSFKLIETNDNLEIKSEIKSEVHCLTTYKPEIF